MEAEIIQVLPAKHHALYIDIKPADNSIMSEFDVGVMQHLLSRCLQELFLPANEFLYIVQLAVFAALPRDYFFREALTAVTRTLLHSDIQLYDIPMIEQAGTAIMVKGRNSGYLLLACTL